MDVSIIIVNYNTCDLTLQCLKSVYEKTEGVEFEVIIVDNMSCDDSAKIIQHKYQQVNVIESKENLGFGKANNLGAKQASGRYLFLLNSDTILISNIVLDFYEFMEANSRFAACGGNLLDVNGIQIGSHGHFPSLMQVLFQSLGIERIFPSWFVNHYSGAMTACQGDISNVEYICGADVFIRQSVFQQMNGFAKEFFMYFEETDLFYRMHQAGYRSCILSQCSIVHLEGASFDKKQSFNQYRFEIYYKSQLLYYKRNGFKIAVPLCRIVRTFCLWTHFYRYFGKITSLTKFLISAQYEV